MKRFFTFIFPAFFLLFFVVSPAFAEYPFDAVSRSIEFSGSNTYTIFASGKNTVLSFGYNRNNNVGSITLKCGSPTIYRGDGGTQQTIAFVPLSYFCDGALSVVTTSILTSGWFTLVSVPRDISVSNPIASGSASVIDIVDGGNFARAISAIIGSLYIIGWVVAIGVGWYLGNWLYKR